MLQVGQLVTSVTAMIRCVHRGVHLDGLFGQCYSDVESEMVKPLILERPLNEIQKKLMRLELDRLATNGYDWPHAESQCVLAYFKLVMTYELDYDTEFCEVRNPKRIWGLIQVSKFWLAQLSSGSKQPTCSAHSNSPRKRRRGGRRQNASTPTCSCHCKR